MLVLRFSASTLRFRNVVAGTLRGEGALTAGALTFIVLDFQKPGRGRGQIGAALGHQYTDLDAIHFVTHRHRRA